MSKALGNITIKQAEGGVIVSFAAENALSVFDNRLFVCRDHVGLAYALREALPDLPADEDAPEPQSVKDTGEFETKAPDRKFKVGDRVCSGLTGYSFDPIEGVVARVWDNYCDVRVTKSAQTGKAIGQLWVYRQDELKPADHEPSSQHPMNAEAIRDADEKEAKLRRDIELACALFGCFPVAP